MRNATLTPARQISLTAAALTLIVHTQAQTTFTDDFRSGPSPLWENEIGSWSAPTGMYRATVPDNRPAAFSSLPFNLTDFSVDFDISGVEDGGIYLRSAPVPGSQFGIQGVLLNLKIPDGGPKIYWHIMTNGTDASVPLHVAFIPYGSHPHVHVEVSGNTYSAFLNGSRTPATTLTTSLFACGRVALYDFSRQGFQNFTLRAVSPQSVKRGPAPGSVSVPTLEKPSPAGAADSVTSETSAQSVASDRPSLNLQTGLVISWPADFTGYVLEQSTDLNTTNWTRVTNPIGVFNQVILPPPSGNRFFRLSTP